MEYLRSLGNYLTAAQLVPVSPVTRNDWDDYCAFLETLDFSRCTHAGPFFIAARLCACYEKVWKQKLIKGKDLQISDIYRRVSKYTAGELFAAKHPCELTAHRENFLTLDLKQQGMGSAACGPHLPEKYTIPDKEYTFEFSFSVTPAMP